MKVVLDTNVVMSGIFFGGVPGRLLEAWTHGRIELVLSPAILDEYRRVGAELAAKYPTRGEALAPVLALIAMHATMVDAAVESFFATVKRELVRKHRWATRASLLRALTHYLDAWYNRERRHSSLGYVSPMEYEQQLTRAA